VSRRRLRLRRLPRLPRQPWRRDQRRERGQRAPHGRSGVERGARAEFGSTPSPSASVSASVPASAADGVCPRHTMQVVVVVVNYYSLRADRGRGLHDLLRILLGLFGSIEALQAHAPSVMLAISQACHPRSSPLSMHPAWRMHPASAKHVTASISIASRSPSPSRHALYRQSRHAPSPSRHAPSPSRHALHRPRRPRRATRRPGCR
jgi:hypothetical protein